MKTKKYNQRFFNKIKSIMIIIILIASLFGFASCMSININHNQSGFSRIIQDFEYLDIRIDWFIYGPSSNSIAIDLTIFDNIVSVESVDKLIQTISEHLESEQFIDYFLNRFTRRAHPGDVFNIIVLRNPDRGARMAYFSRNSSDEDFVYNWWTEDTFQGWTR